MIYAYKPSVYAAVANWSQKSLLKKQEITVLQCSAAEPQPKRMTLHGGFRHDVFGQTS
jgi:hypothetical protein